jgi:hypothetical protein
MTHHARAEITSDRAERQPSGSELSADELRAEQADDLPEREALSIVCVGGLEDGLPPASALDDVVSAEVPINVLPVDGLPVERYPVDRLSIDTPIEGPVQLLPVEPPVDTLPVEPPIDTLPVEPPIDQEPVGVPASAVDGAESSSKV